MVRVMKGFSVLLVVMAFLALPSRAMAIPITGNITISGGATLDGPIGTANAVTTWLNPEVQSRTGSFAGIAVGTAVTMTAPWVFDPSTALPALWTVGGFTFNLASSTIALQNSTFLTISGLGTITGPAGFDPTAGSFNFTTQSPDAAGVFSFSAANTVVGVPDGGSTIALLGMGLLALSSLRRRFARR